MTERCVIVGAGGHGREVAELAEAVGRRVLGFLDDATSAELARRPGGRSDPLLGPIDAGVARGVPAVLGIGRPDIRAAVDARLMAHDRPVASPLVHPSVVRSTRVDLEAGTVIAAGCVLTVDVRLGRHVLLNRSCNVGHDVAVGALTAVMPGAILSGGVAIGARVLVGAGAVILEGVTVGDDARIGAGAVVVRDVAPGQTVVGVPARPRSV